MTWRTPRTPPKVQGRIDFYAAIERANGKHPAPAHPSKGESNMSNDQWKWWVGHDEERYTTECDSREEAVQIAKEEFEGAYIVEAIQANNIRLSEYFDATTFMENADENAWNDHGDPEGGHDTFYKMVRAGRIAKHHPYPGSHPVYSVAQIDGLYANSSD
jgi:hypothetical protein